MRQKSCCGPVHHGDGAEEILNPGSGNQCPPRPHEAETDGCDYASDDEQGDGSGRVDDGHQGCDCAHYGSHGYHSPEKFLQAFDGVQFLQSVAVETDGCGHQKTHDESVDADQATEEQHWLAVTEKAGYMAVHPPSTMRWWPEVALAEGLAK